ncbi:ACP phosphodiesterase [Lutibacter sp.]|uniref:acyl carrier protein phosphodiesterase n=1 Tax=Lutibacter sp. TaxID=1925666 RepID=UPI0027336696|nr:ACP phosphodiesterase [Lutibacter sp.]MDP3313476.1 ACP phosphodiesterase [Lutibacter sp.]
MNFLAHLYLSKNNKNILIGNFIADAVKGNKYLNYTKEVQLGILLHREIDTFTDNHPFVKISKRRLNPQYRHYKGIIIDIFYDHFLAKNWQLYSQIPLEIYAEETYLFLQKNSEKLPAKVQQFLPFMIEYNWLVSYALVEGIEEVLKGMNRRTKGISKMDLAINDLKLNYQEFEQDFQSFFIDLEKFTQEKTTFLLQQ